jgi:hypothetical protein
MDVTQILGELATSDRVPVEAIEAARSDGATLAPAFVRLIEQFVAGDELPEHVGALFVAFHLLGEWREKTAYRPIAALLRLPQHELEDVLGEAVDRNSHRVMAAVFDRDPMPVYDIIRDPEADEAARSRMLEALAMVTLRGELPREETTRFLRACFTELPQRPCFMWDGWQNAIAMLGLVELAPLVKQAFGRGFIDPTLDFEDFETELRNVLDGGSPLSGYGENEFELFGDTIEELSGWAYPDDDDAEEDDDWESDDWESDEPEERVSDEQVLWRASAGPAHNPYKGVGRNDPCPCGSGKKFKKCCLGKADALRPAGDSGARPLSDLVADLHRSFPEDDVTHPTEPHYDPLVAPDPAEWLALDEQERIDMVVDFHRRARIKLPNAKVHAVLHSVVENQVAEGDALPVRRTLERLTAEGLDRHDAVHAIGGVLIGHMRDLMAAGRVEGDPNLPYYAELERLTADKWRRSG